MGPELRSYLEQIVTAPGLENRDYSLRESAALITRHPSIRKKFALTTPTSGGRSVGIVCSRTQATEFSFARENTK
jgi:hypothetical protein